MLNAGNRWTFATEITMMPAVYADDDEESTEIDSVRTEAKADADAENDDVVVQSNDADVAQITDNDCEAAAAVSDDDVVGVTGANVAVAANDCDNRFNTRIKHRTSQCQR